MMAEKTESFQSRNGIPQEGMSSILFNLYLNDLGLLDRFEENKSSNDPVNVMNTKLSILIYADDMLFIKSIPARNDIKNENY